MDDNTFYLNMWRLAAAAFATLVLTLGGCNAYTTRLTTAAIAASSDPLATACALNGSKEYNIPCFALSARKP